MSKYMHNKHQKNYRKRQQEERSRNGEPKKTWMSDAERQRARRERFKVKVLCCQDEQVLDMSVPVQAMRDVKYLYNKELDLLYLTAVKERGDNSCSKPEIFLPLSTVSDFTLTWIKKVQDILCSDHEEKGLTLAMKEHDSTVVYYRMTQGLVPPDSPDTARRNKQREEQKRCIEMEVRKMRQELLDKACSVGKSENDKAECTGADVGKVKDLTGDGDKIAECKISQENPREPDVSSTETDNEKAKPT